MTPLSGGIIHSDHGVQLPHGPCRPRQTVRPVSSMGLIGKHNDKAIFETPWGRMQTEHLNRRGWRTRIKLANAIFDILEIFHNRQLRRSPSEGAVR